MTVLSFTPVQDVEVLSFNAKGTYASVQAGTYVMALRRSLRVGQNLGAGDYEIYKSLLAFDTSIIGAGASVTAATLTVYLKTNNVATNFTLQAWKQSWAALYGTAASLQDAITATAFSTAGVQDANVVALTNATALATAQVSGALDATWVNKAGVTYYALQTSRLGTQPAGAEFVELYSTESGPTSYLPLLTVTFTSGGSPTGFGSLGEGVGGIS